MKKRFCTFLPLLATLICFQTGFSQSPSRREILLAGDAVRIQVWQLYENVKGKSPASSLSNIYVIDTKGYIFMPFVGLIHVANKTPDEVAELIKQEYTPYISDPFIYVRPLIRVTLRGAVTRPGSFRVDPKSSFWDLMEEAKGPLTSADLEKMYVERGGMKVNDDLLQAFEKAYSLSEVGIESGDQIVIPPRGRSFSMRTVMSYVTSAAALALLYIRVSDRVNK